MLPTPQERPTLTVAEVAKFIGLGRDKTYELVRNGIIPSITVGRRYVVPTSSLWKFLHIQEISTTNDNNPQ